MSKQQKRQYKAKKERERLIRQINDRRVKDPRQKRYHRNNTYYKNKRKRQNNEVNENKSYDSFLKH